MKILCPSCAKIIFEMVADINQSIICNLQQVHAVCPYCGEEYVEQDDLSLGMLSGETVALASVLTDQGYLS